MSALLGPSRRLVDVVTAALAVQQLRSLKNAGSMQINQQDGHPTPGGVLEDAKRKVRSNGTSQFEEFLRSLDVFSKTPQQVADSLVEKI